MPDDALDYFRWILLRWSRPLSRYRASSVVAWSIDGDTQHRFNVSILLLTTDGSADLHTPGEIERAILQYNIDNEMYIDSFRETAINNRSLVDGWSPCGHYEDVNAYWRVLRSLWVRHSRRCLACGNEKAARYPGNDKCWNEECWNEDCALFTC